MTIPEVHILPERGEVIDDLLSIKITKIGLIAEIGKVSVLLPEELAGCLQSLIGKRIGILRLGGYHLCAIDAPSREHSRQFPEVF
jgi:hypothetical protein